MAKQLTDDELNLRRKARHRLIGAIALTLVVVVALPMVLDSEPKPTGQDIELRIPAPDKVGEFIPGVAASEVAGASPFAASAVVAASAPLPAPADGAASQAANNVAVSGVAHEVAKPVAVPTPSVAAPGKQSVTPTNSRTEVPGKVQATVNKTPEPKVADRPARVEGYVAQVGAYANADTAKQEADKLKKLGFKVYTEKIGDKTRVRVGPYAEREKAEKARQLLEKHGLHPTVMSAS